MTRIPLCPCRHHVGQSRVPVFGGGGAGRGLCAAGPACPGARPRRLSRGVCAEDTGNLAEEAWRMGEGTRGAGQGLVERLGTRGGSDGLEGRGSRLELQPGPKADLSPVLPVHAHPPRAKPAACPPGGSKPRPHSCLWIPHHLPSAGLAWGCWERCLLCRVGGGRAVCSPPAAGSHGGSGGRQGQGGSDCLTYGRQDMGSSVPCLSCPRARRGWASGQPGC